MLSLFRTYMLLMACDFAVVRCIRLSPDGPDDLLASLRSRIVLPARSLMTGIDTSCDSLTSGPRCAFFNGFGDNQAVHGVIDGSLWGYTQDEIPENVLLALSGYAQVTWRGSMQKYNHASTVTALKTIEHDQMYFDPIPVDTESQQFTRSETPQGSSYRLNSFYSYISFKGKFVSIVEFQILAPTDTGVFVRGYDDGVPRWFRHVRPGTILDIGLPSLKEDPSLEGVDYIEIVGTGARILSLTISVDPTTDQAQTQPTLLFIDAAMNADITKLSGRKLHSSAYVIDMDTAVRKNMRFTDPPEMIASAKDEIQFSYDHLIKCLNSTNIHRPDYPAKTIDSFIQGVEMYMKQHPDANFYETFTNKLVEAPPDLVAFVIRVPDEPPLVYEPDIPDDVFYNTLSIRFQPSGNRSIEVRSPLIDSLLTSLETVLGPTGLTDFVTTLKVNRFLRDTEMHPNTTVHLTDQETMDEEILMEIIVSILDLPAIDQLPYESRKTVLADAITMLVPPGTTTAFEIEELVDILLN